MKSTARAAVVRALLFTVGALPFVSWSLSASSSGAPFVQLCERWFRFQCHGRVDRTLELAGQLFPVCSRCLGIYGGLVTAAAVARPHLSPGPRRAWMLGAAAFMIGEVLVQDVTGHAPIHWLRLLTGFALAYPVALTVIDAARATRVDAAASQAAP